MEESMLRACRTAFPAAVHTIRVGEAQERSILALQTEGVAHASEGDVDGNIPGVRGTLAIIVSECAPWPVPADGDTITLFDADNTLIGTFDILGHRNSPSGAIRRLQYGEDGA